MSKGLYITIALLVTVAVALVLAKGKDSQRSTIHVKGPSSQNQNKEKKLRNFDAEIVANANEFLTGATLIPNAYGLAGSISIRGPARGELSVTGTPLSRRSRCVVSAGFSIHD